LAGEGRSRGERLVRCGQEWEGQLMVVGWLVTDGQGQLAMGLAGWLGLASIDRPN